MFLRSALVVALAASANAAAPMRLRGGAPATYAKLTEGANALTDGYSTQSKISVSHGSDLNGVSFVSGPRPAHFCTPWPAPPCLQPPTAPQRVRALRGRVRGGAANWAGAPTVPHEDGGKIRCTCLQHHCNNDVTLCQQSTGLDPQVDLHPRLRVQDLGSLRRQVVVPGRQPRRQARRVRDHQWRGIL